MLSMCCFVSMAWSIGRAVKSFGGGKEEVLNDKEDVDVDELDEEEDVVEDVSDSESSPSVALCFKDGKTVGSRTDRPEIGNRGLWDLLRFRWRVILDSHTIWELSD